MNSTVAYLKNLIVEADQNSPRESQMSEKGFSLIEILVALTLLGIAGTFVAGKIFEKLEEGQIQAAKIQMEGLEAQLKEFRRKCGFYPPQEAGLNALIEKPSGSRECKNYPPEGFLEDGMIPLDPWEYDYVYKLEGSKPYIMSSGPDGLMDTEDDISSRPEKRRN
ncbi:MAG: type II secretion system major pseudopilin GspG [Bdellovibrionota bacterium]|jgi:general secretion pathway protein G|nr:type II secretion system major pseudopilin GspG [Bdellovibrionota bacterium]